MDYHPVGRKWCCLHLCLSVPPPSGTASFFLLSSSFVDNLFPGDARSQHGFRLNRNFSISSQRPEIDKTKGISVGSTDYKWRASGGTKLEAFCGSLVDSPTET